MSLTPKSALRHNEVTWIVIALIYFFLPDLISFANLMIGHPGFVTRILLRSIHFMGFAGGTCLQRTESRKTRLQKPQPQEISSRGVTTMLTKTKIALAAMLLAGTASAAMAQEGFFLPNMPNQYRAAAPHATLRSAPVALHKGRGNYGGTESEFDIDRSDRASSPYAGGM
jgi:hypothetical protein